MKIATFNTNSVRARLPIITDWLTKEQPDILALQEIKVQDRDFPVNEFEELGYNTVTRGQKSYNGVAVISRFEPEHIIRNLYREEDEQARFLSVLISGITIINVYVPQGFSPDSEKFTYKLKWLEDLLIFIEKNHTPESPVIFLGDFNVAMDERDLYDPEGLRGSAGYHPEEQKRLSKFFEWGFIDIFRKYHSEGGLYTFWDYRIPNALKRKMGWRLDYITATSPLAEKSTGVRIDLDARLLKRPSDHTFLIAEFDI